MGIFILNTLLNDSRFLKKIVLLIAFVITWMDNVDAATTDINADNRVNRIPIDIKRDTVGNPSLYETSNVNKRCADELNSPNLDVSGGKPESYRRQYPSKAETNDILELVKSAEPDNEDLKLILPQFKQILKNAITRLYKNGPDRSVFILNDEDDKSTQSNKTTVAENNLPHSDEITNSEMDANHEKTVENDAMKTTSDDMKQKPFITKAYIYKNLFPPRVSVIVTKPKGYQRNTTITLPLEVEMTVWKALISATRAYTSDNPDDEDNPFDIIIDYDRKLDCYVAINAVGIKRRQRYAWIFTVRDMNDKLVYRGQCIPGNAVILRPSSVLQLTYRRIRSRKA